MVALSDFTFGYLVGMAVGVVCSVIVALLVFGGRGGD